MAASRTQLKAGPLSGAEHLAGAGYVYLPSGATGLVLDRQWELLAQQWDYLCVDPYYRGTGFRRERRYARLSARLAGDAGVDVVRLPHEDFVQTTSANALFDGVVRRFEPCGDSLLANPLLLDLIALDLAIVGRHGITWDVGIHQIRVCWDGSAAVTATPEGRHNDGHQFIAMHLVAVSPSSGGVSLVFETRDPARPVFAGRLEAGDTLIVDDRRVLHEVSPVTPIGGPGARDMLIIDFRGQVPETERADAPSAHGLQGPRAMRTLRWAT
jgi:hypothetical protein